MQAFWWIYCVFCGKCLGCIVAEKEPLAVCEKCEKEHGKKLSSIKRKMMR
jgi:hypothetical protein